MMLLVLDNSFHRVPLLTSLYCGTVFVLHVTTAEKHVKLDMDICR